MPTPTTYTYDIGADLPDGKVSSSRLATEVASSSIITAIDSISVESPSIVLGVATGGTLKITFKDVLSAADKTTLDGDTAGPAGGLLAANDNSPKETGPLLDDGVALAKSQPQPVGYELCERDFKVVTCKMTQATAVEDKLMNVATLKEEEWAGPELALVGVYKDVAGTMTICDDQADADVNGILSVWDYQAVDQADGTTQIKYCVRNGSIVLDPNIPAGERFDHRAYVVIAPDLGQANYVRSFDGYVAGRPAEGELSVDNPAAKVLDPALAAGGASAVVRVYIRHPQGQVNSHILWLMTYRPAGTF